MSSKEDILKKYRANIREQFDMPDLSDIQAITYPDPLLQFMNMTKSVGGNSIEVDAGRDINELIRELYPDAKGDCLQPAGDYHCHPQPRRGRPCPRPERNRRWHHSWQVRCGRKRLCVDTPANEGKSRLLYL